MTGDNSRKYVFGLDCLWLVLLIVDIYYLLTYWRSYCDQNLQIWLLVNIIIWIFTSSIAHGNDNNFECTRLISILVTFGILIWGFVIFTRTEECEINIYNLTLAHLIIQSIILSCLGCELFLVGTLITASIAYLCFQPRLTDEEIPLISNDSHIVTIVECERSNY